MGDFAAVLGGRLDRARKAIQAAGESGDEYGVATHLAELEALVRVADQHGLSVDPSIRSAVRDAIDRNLGG